MQFASLTCRTKNIGDDIQVVAALQYLPTDLRLVDRDRIGSLQLSKPTKMILNGWWMHSPAKWPPPAEIDPLILSFYAEPSKFERSWRLGYLREQSRRRPIGARDPATLSLFLASDIDAYLSGCLTLTLLANATGRGDHVLAVDMGRDLLPRLARHDYRAITHYLGGERFLLPHRWRLRRAVRLLAEYAAARVVVTTRLHTALPCLAFGTPVLFVAPEAITGRLAGWLPHLNWCSRQDWIAGRVDYDLNAPRANPDTWRAMADGLVNACETYTSRRRVPVTAETITALRAI